MLGERKFYLTEQGLKKIKKEYNGLKTIRLLKTTGEFPKILQSEDVNPEYLSLQEDLDFLDTRIAELENVLKNVVMIQLPPKEKQDVVNLGARVLIEVDGQTDEFEIIGSLEANPALGKISNQSPVGSALLGHKVGDKVVVQSAMKTVYKIKKIKYSAAS